MMDRSAGRDTYFSKWDKDLNVEKAVLKENKDHLGHEIKLRADAEKLLALSEAEVREREGERERERDEIRQQQAAAAAGSRQLSGAFK